LWGRLKKKAQVYKASMSLYISFDILAIHSLPFTAGLTMSCTPTSWFSSSWKCSSRTARTRNAARDSPDWPSSWAHIWFGFTWWSTTQASGFTRSWRSFNFRSASCSSRPSWDSRCRSICWASSSTTPSGPRRWSWPSANPTRSRLCLVSVPCSRV